MIFWSDQVAQIFCFGCFKPHTYSNKTNFNILQLYYGILRISSSSGSPVNSPSGTESENSVISRIRVLDETLPAVLTSIDKELKRSPKSSDNTKDLGSTDSLVGLRWDDGVCEVFPPDTLLEALS